MSLLIVDYGMGNLHSVQRSLEEVGAACFISDSPSAIKECSGIIIPGVGAFPDGMKNLEATGMADAIRDAAAESRTPVLGICLGMQLLASRGLEGGDTAGLGLIPGVVDLLPRLPDERIPHVGWNEISITREDPLLEGVKDHTDFYFVHSYAFKAEDPGYIIATTPYAGGFPSIIGHGTVRGCQFHPERSSKAGFRILTNFLSLCHS